MVNQCGIGCLVVGLVEYFAENGVGDGYQKYAGWLNDLTVNAANFSDIYKECSIPSACWMVHREDFERCGGIGTNYPEDYDLAFRFYQAKLQINPVTKVLHHWRDHGARASRNDPNYADNRFLNIKLNYFLKIDKSSDPLVLLGAGKKGKELARKLITTGVDFIWATNNAKKIGVNIYHQLLVSDQGLPKEVQVIIAVAGSEGEELRTRFPEGFFFA